MIYGGKTMPKALANRWRAEAELFDQYGSPLAAACRRHADELEAALRSHADEALDLATAAREAGYSRDRLRHLVAEGTVPNAGRKGSPRIRRGDLPLARRSAGKPGAFDAAATARDVLQVRTKP